MRPRSDGNEEENNRSQASGPEPGWLTWRMLRIARSRTWVGGKSDLTGLGVSKNKGIVRGQVQRQQEISHILKDLICVAKISVNHLILKIR